jgi:hypothetical protein
MRWGQRRPSLRGGHIGSRTLPHPPLCTLWRPVSVARLPECAVNVTTAEDDFSDLSQERPLPDPIDLREALPAPLFVLEPAPGTGL